MTSGPGKILIVDDEKDVVLVLGEFLTREGFDVSSASSGEEALKRVRETCPDIVLLDMAMPGMNGLETLPALKKIAPQMVVLMITAYRDAEKVVESFRLGASDCLFKPFDFNYIREILKAKFLPVLSSGSPGAESEHLKKYLDTSRYLVMHDGLTGLCNALGLSKAVEQELERYRRYQASFVLALADLDHFKNVNDRFGHQAGDRVLQEVASVLSRSVRTLDTVARYGGEEFAVLFPHTDLEGARVACERLLRVVRETPFSSPSGKISMTMSLGIATLAHGASNWDELVGQADKALYRAKETGRDRLVVFDAAWGRTSQQGLAS